MIVPLGRTVDDARSLQARIRRRVSAVDGLAAVGRRRRALRMIAETLEAEVGVGGSVASFAEERDEDSVSLRTLTRLRVLRKLPCARRSVHGERGASLFEKGIVPATEKLTVALRDMLMSAAPAPELADVLKPPRRACRRR